MFRNQLIFDLSSLGVHDLGIKGEKGNMITNYGEFKNEDLSSKKSGLFLKLIFVLDQMKEKRIVAFGASSSRQSINKQFVSWAGSQLEGVEITLLDLNDFEMPIYSIDREREKGGPVQAAEFYDYIKSSDGLMISLAEHNGSYTSAFKNIFDWTSRVEKKLWSDKHTLLLATSPGGRGGLNVLNTATMTFPHMGAKVMGSFSLPFFTKNFNPQEGITDSELRKDFHLLLEKFENLVKHER